MSKRFPKRWRNAETPEELLEVRGINSVTDETSKLPGAGVKLIVGIVVGLGLTMFVVGVIWRFLTR
jgi:hypothetical protein